MEKENLSVDLGTYQPSAIEENCYEFWEKNGVFHDEPDESKEAYSIVLPPPNVTGQLHMGHALDNTCLLYTSPSPRDRTRSRMPSSA